jgi:5-deoxy-glucuronate isomerase
MEGLIRGSRPVEPGWTELVSVDRFSLALGRIRLDGKAPWSRTESDLETGLVLLEGEGEVQVGPHRCSVRRGDWRDGPGHAWLVPAGTRYELSGRAEWAVVHTRNPAAFSPHHVPPERCRSEPRGQGARDDAAFRWVRTYVDDREGPAAARLVLGEVRALPGRWSSYPPHHHPQPELYHYRFADPRGYGHAEHGDEVAKVTDGDTLCIEGGRTHAQCAAPGYDMFYLWAIRHLDAARYDGPTFDPEHRWLLKR